MKDNKQLIRILNTDLIASKQVYHGLTKIKGVSYSFSNAVCLKLKLDRTKLIQELSKEEITKIEETVKTPGFKPWLLNCQTNYETGKDDHTSTTDLKFKVDSNKKKLMKIKSYRGLRHSAGLPVRGQRTKGHFRKTGKAVGVSKKKGVKKGK
ncbi:30S ribosomal protein S13 [archaeon]|jgi:small subunit ribosomal protein S13|nr:30S ribosomal protein S13 [archaeon]MBT4416907.1 30S ribosomal protein S13 [archaeon]